MERATPRAGPNPTTAPAPPSDKLKRMLAKLTPAEREQAISMAAALLNKRAQREAKAIDGRVDLTTKD
jgi:hypothetical protein